MGCYSTLRVSRNAALLALAITEFGHLSNSDLEERLDVVLEPGLRSARITTSSESFDLDELGRAIGTDLSL